MKLKDFLVESPATVTDIEKAIKDSNVSKMDLELISRKMFDRELTNYSTAWQRTYFSDSINKKGGKYPNGKERMMDRASEDSKVIVDFYNKISSKLNGMITDKAVLDYFAKKNGIKDIKSFLKGPFLDQLKQSGQLYPTNENIHPKGYTLVETINFDKLVESIGTVKLTGKLGTMASLFGQLKPKQIIAININGEFTNVEDFGKLKEELVYMADKKTLDKIAEMITNPKKVDNFNKYKDLELPKVVNSKSFNDTLFAQAVLDANNATLQVMATAPKIPGEAA